MPLNTTVLSDLMVTKLEEQFPRGFNKIQREEIEKFTVALADAVISHFTANAQVTVNTNVTTTTPVTTETSLQRIPASVLVGTPTDGPASTVNLAGTGTGTGTGTLS